MPTPLDIALYELGVRLSQCGILNEECVRDIETGPDDVALLRKLLDKLGSTFDRVATKAEFSEFPRAACSAIIDACAGHWAELARLRNLRIANVYYVQEQFGKFRDHVLKGIPATNRQIWLLLGEQIAAGWWADPVRRPLPVRCKKPCFIHDDREPLWVWDDEELLRQLLDKVGLPTHQVFPKLDHRRPETMVFPYATIRYKPWERIEAGLGQLVESVVDETMKPADPDSPWSRIRVDIDQQIVYVKGGGFRIDSREAACYLAALVEAQGAWMGPKDIANKYPDYVGSRADRVKKQIPYPVLDAIETQGAKGSRIPRSKLLQLLNPHDTVVG
jgi:hypothetical protein